MLLKVPAVFPLVAELTLALDTASENLLFLTPVFCCAELVNIEVVMLVGIAPLTLVLVLFAELLSDASLVDVDCPLLDIVVFTALIFFPTSETGVLKPDALFLAEDGAFFFLLTFCICPKPRKCIL